MDVLIDFVNFLIRSVASALSWAFSLFPDSPFLNLRDPVPSGVNISWITWFIPFPSMILHFSLFLSALTVYYVVRVVARWLKVIRS
ncbi:MAG: hypothetical protein K6T72_14365 [Anoxybacillus sp.]|nr:hypothetical protein [Anoxybacillus sp.]MCL6587670.1 hypothetical protein [Anoxybacillus sp.]